MSNIVNCSVDKLASGVYRARKMYKGQSITYVGEVGESIADVKRKFNQLFEDTIRNGTVSSHWKVAKWLDYWLETYKKPLDFEKEQLRNKTKGGRVSASSYSRMNQTYKSQIKETREGKLLLRKQLQAVKPDDIQRLINELEEKGLSDSTVKKAQNFLTAAFNEAMKNGYMLSNPALYVKRNGLIHTSNGENQKVNILTADEVSVFVEEALRVDEKGNAIYPYGAGVVLQLAIGCRSGELRALDWEHVTEDMINIQHSVSWVKNFDENDSSEKKTKPYISTTKSNSSRRKIPYKKGSIIDKCLDILRKRCEGIENTYNLVMPTSKGWYLTPNNYNNQIKKIVGNINVNSLSSHSLRHTFISLLVNDKNRDLATVASLVGHGDIRVTLHYANHTDMKKKKKTLNVISGLMSQ